MSGELDGVFDAGGLDLHALLDLGADGDGDEASVDLADVSAAFLDGGWSLVDEAVEAAHDLLHVTDDLDES